MINRKFEIFKQEILDDNIVEEVGDNIVQEVDNNNVEEVDNNNVEEVDDFSITKVRNSYKIETDPIVKPKKVEIKDTEKGIQSFVSQMNNNYSNLDITPTSWNSSVFLLNSDIPVIDDINKTILYFRGIKKGHIAKNIADKYSDNIGHGSF